MAAGTDGTEAAAAAADDAKPGQSGANAQQQSSDADGRATRVDGGWLAQRVRPTCQPCHQWVGGGDGWAIDGHGRIKAACSGWADTGNVITGGSMPFDCLP